MSRPGWSSIPNWLLDDTDVPLHSKMVFIYLASHLDEDGIAFPGQPLIAERLNISVPTVRRAIRDLRQRGLVSVHTVATPTGRHNRYRILVDRFGQRGVGSQ